MAVAMMQKTVIFEIIPLALQVLNAPLTVEAFSCGIALRTFLRPLFVGITAKNSLLVYNLLPSLNLISTSIWKEVRLFDIRDCKCKFIRCLC